MCILLQAFILQKHLYDNRLDDSDLESSDWKNCTGRASLVNDKHVISKWTNVLDDIKKWIICH